MPFAATTRMPALRTTVSAALLVLAASMAVPGAATAQRQAEPAQSVTIGFDDHPANRVGTPAAAGITDFYRQSGLVFDRPVTALVYNDRSVPADPGFPRSGSTVITTCYAAEFCSNDIEMRLLWPHERVRLWVGYDGSLRTAATLLLIGLDGEQQPVTRDVVSLGPTEVRLPVDTPVQISDPEGRISSVRLVWADDSRFLSGLSVDDIELTPFVATASVEFETDVVRLNADDGPVEQQVRLVNTGDVEVEVAAVEIEVADPGLGADQAARFDVDDSACITVLERGSSCAVTVFFAAEEPGTQPARLIARDSADAALALATLEGVFGGADTTDTTDASNTSDTTGESTNDTTTDGTDTTTEPTADTVTDATTGSGLEPGQQSGLDDRQDSSAPVAGSIAMLLIAALAVTALAGLTIAVRRIGRGRKQPPRPEHHPKPRPKPELSVQPGDGAHHVVGDDGPLVAIRAVIGPGQTQVIESRTS